MESKSTKSVARSRFLPRAPREAVLKGNIMSSTTRTTRIPNHKIDQMFRELVPFSNYNASIVATRNDHFGFYSVTHWDTEIVRIDLAERDHHKDSVISFNFRYYSQTTSALQGRIVRNLLTRSEVANLLDWYQNQGSKEYATKLKRLARIR